jgi:hypothetical protein
MIRLSGRIRAQTVASFLAPPIRRTRWQRSLLLQQASFLGQVK